MCASVDLSGRHQTFTPPQAVLTGTMFTLKPPHKEFLAGFSVRGLVVSKKKSAASRRVFVVFKNFPRLRRGFIVVQRSVCLLQIFTVFALKKLKIFPPLRGGVLLFKKFPPLRGGVLLFPKKIPPLRGGVLLFPGFSEKLAPGICNGGF